MLGNRSRGSWGFARSWPWPRLVLSGVEAWKIVNIMTRILVYSERLKLSAQVTDRFRKFNQSGQMFFGKQAANFYRFFASLFIYIRSLSFFFRCIFSSTWYIHSPLNWHLIDQHMQNTITFSTNVSGTICVRT